MNYSTVSQWTLTEWNAELEAIARDTFVPLLMSVGAQRVQMIRTGDLSLCVVTEYADAAAAEAAQTRIADIRAKAASELPMSLVSSAGGAVFAKG